VIPNRRSLNPSTCLWTLGALVLLSSGAPTVLAAPPYSEATVTRVQNKVSYGEQRGAESVTRPAAAQDVVRPKNFLLSENDSRAELQYADGTIVRIGQNTVFSFEADSRTLSLTKGSLIFYVPKGQGGATIKTPSLTAAITGTVGKVSRDTIAIIEGSVKLVPSGEVVVAGQFARRNPDGTITIGWFKKGTEFDGVLMTFNGPLPPFRDLVPATGAVTFDMTAINLQEVLDRTAIHPGALKHFFPIQPKRRKDEKDRPNATPTPIVKQTAPTRTPGKDTTPPVGSTPVATPVATPTSTPGATPVIIFNPGL